MTDAISLIVRGKRTLTPNIAEFVLAAPDGCTLPPSEAGAHITVETPCGAMRRYSLVTPDPAPSDYRIAVKREPGSRGGSVSMHDDLAVGDLIDIQPPQNDFPLSQAPGHLLIAGGIGITPILAMARTLHRDGLPFRLIYCTRTAEETAYRDEARSLCGDRLTLHHDNGDLSRVYDFWDDFETPGKVHVFCCGPAPLMEEVRAVSGHWPEGAIHFEDFKPVEVTRPDDTPFTVTLAPGGQTVTVPADRSILEALRDSGIRTHSSCESGTCGTCKCVLVDGEADHRDMVLMDDEKAGHIMICVSRARGESLVIRL